MKKIVSGLKKIGVMGGVFLSSLYTKVLAAEMDMIEILYGPPDLYETPLFWKIMKKLIIPIAFIIGAIVYFKKSSSSNVRKVITILIALAIVVLAYFGVNYVITNLI